MLHKDRDFSCTAIEECSDQILTVLASVLEHHRLLRGRRGIPHRVDQMSLRVPGLCNRTEARQPFPIDLLRQLLEPVETKPVIQVAGELEGVC